MRAHLESCGSLAFLLLFVTAGCVPATVQRPTTPSIDEPTPVVSGITVDERVISLSGPAAAEYCGPIEHTLEGAEAALTQLLMGVGGFVHDPALSRAARELARNSPDAQTVPGSLVDGVLSWTGLVDPRPRLTILEFTDSGHRCLSTGTGPNCTRALHTIGRAVANGLPEVELRLGIGMTPVGPNRTRVVVAASERVVEVAPMPRSLPSGGRLELRGRLLGPRARPRIVVVDGNGGSHQFDARTGPNGAFGATIACEHGDGQYQVEVIAEGSHGPEVVVNFRLYCGVEIPRTTTMRVEQLAPSVGLDDIVRANFAALNEERQRNGLGPLQWSDEAAAVARAHSEDMARAGFVGHTSPTTGSAGERFDRAGVENALVRENIARGYGPMGMHEGLMTSPGHRGNILAEDVIFVGIGAAYDSEPTSTPDAQRPVLLTQNFYSPRGADVPDRPLPALIEEVAERRREAGLRPFNPVDRLSGAAQVMADGLASGNQDAARRRYNAALDAGTGYRRVQTRVVIAASFHQLQEVDIWSAPTIENVGLGLAIMRGGDEEGSIVLVIATGSRPE